MPSKMTEKKAHWIYDRLLKRIVIPMIGNDTTYEGELLKLGIKL